MAEVGKGFRAQAAEMARMIVGDSAPWQMEWKAARDTPAHNPAAGAPYRGFNALYLEAQGRADPRWMTAKQAASLGGEVRAGEKPVAIEYTTFTDRVPLTDETGVPVLEADRTPVYREVRLDEPKTFLCHVYNGAQIDGLEPFEKPPRPPSVARMANERAEKILEGGGVKIAEDARGRSFYSRREDTVHLAERECFVSGAEYLSEGFRQMARATGHESRLDRGPAPYGTRADAREQMRSEIAGFLVARETGVSYMPDDDRGQADTQAELLRKDPNELFRAARDAETIKTWIIEPEARPELERLAKDRNAAAEIREKEGTEMIDGRETEGQQAPRHYLSVPYEEKDAARAAGARWDRAAKSWYAPEGGDPGKLSAWDTVSGKAASRPELLSPQEEFGAACRNHGLAVEGEPEMDGRWHRVPVEGDKGRGTSGSYRGYLDGVPSGTITNFRDGGTVKWVASGRALTPEKKEALAAEAQEKKAGRAAERERGTEEAAKVAYGIWSNRNWAKKDRSPYLTEKDVEVHAIKHDGKQGLIVPARNVEGKLRSLHFIDLDGSKRMLVGGMKAGCMHAIDPKKELRAGKIGGPIVIAEGYATAASLHEATKRPVVCAFDAGNLKPVAEALRARYPKAEIVIAADDDRAKGHTVGLDKAAEAAQAVGGEFVAPRFTQAEKAQGMTDYNDLARSRGKEAVREELAPALGLGPKQAAEQEQSRQREQAPSRGREAGGMEL